MKPTKAARAFAPDALRGLIIVFMALDHANHFVAQHHSSGEYPFHLWLAYRGFDGRLPETATHAATPSLRNAWVALLCSLVLVVVSLGFTG